MRVAVLRSRAARPSGPRLLTTAGPAVGARGCGITRQPVWPGFLPARVLVGLWLVTVIGMLAAALGTRYRLAARAGVAERLGTVALGGVMIIDAIFVIPSVTWIAVVAVAASSVRMTFSTRTLSRFLVQ